MDKSDFEYKGCYVMFTPHPSLKGKYEVRLIDYDYFVGRFQNKKLSINGINDFLKSDIYKKYLK